MTKLKATDLSPIARLEALTMQKQAKMLRLTLERIRQKQAHGYALSLAEVELLTECRRRYYSKSKETVKLDSQGRVTVTRSNDVSPIMDAMKAYGDILGTNPKSRVAGTKMVGAIDPITATNWSKETGLKVGTKEFAIFASKRIKNDIDYRGFKVGG